MKSKDILKEIIGINRNHLEINYFRISLSISLSLSFSLFLFSLSLCLCLSLSLSSRCVFPRSLSLSLLSLSLSFSLSVSLFLKHARAHVRPRGLFLSQLCRRNTTPWAKSRRTAIWGIHKRGCTPPASSAAFPITNPIRLDLQKPRERMMPPLRQTAPPPAPRLPQQAPRLARSHLGVDAQQLHARRLNCFTR